MYSENTEPEHDDLSAQKTDTRGSQKSRPAKAKSKAKVRLNTDLYAYLTPAGAFYLVANKKMTTQKKFLLNILVHGHKYKMSQQSLQEWGGNTPLKDTIKTFYRFQQLGYVQGVNQPPKFITEGRLDDLLAQYMVKLSSTKQAVLADANGLYISSVGYPHEVSEELAAMSVDLMTLHERHQQLINNNLKIATESFALVDAQGRSQLKFIPLHVGEHCFALVLAGVPQLQTEFFTQLIQLLAIKYVTF